MFKTLEEGSSRITSCNGKYLQVKYLFSEKYLKLDLINTPKANSKFSFRSLVEENIFLNNHAAKLSDKKVIPKANIKDKNPFVLGVSDLVYPELHVKMGHLGVDRSMQLIKDRFYWPGMSSDISHFITKVCSCVKKKRSPKLEKAPLQCISINVPMELVDLDFLHLDPCGEGCEYIGISDHF